MKNNRLTNAAILDIIKPHNKPYNRIPISQEQKKQSIIKPDFSPEGKKLSIILLLRNNKPFDGSQKNELCI